MKIRFPRWVWLATGIWFVKLGPCDCDQDYCLGCEIKFCRWGFFRRFVPYRWR